MWLPALRVREKRSHNARPPVSCNRSLCPIVPALTYLWTLSLGYRPLKVTLPFELLLTDFPRWSISFPCANYLPPRGLRRQFFPKFYGFMVSLKLWYQTGDLSSFLSSLRPSVSSAAPHQSLLRIPSPVNVCLSIRFRLFFFPSG